MEAIRIIAIRQVDGGTRFLALSHKNHQRALQDRALVDHMPNEGYLDVEPSGRRVWYAASKGRAAIETHLKLAELDADDAKQAGEV